MTKRMSSALLAVAFIAASFSVTDLANARSRSNSDHDHGGGTSRSCLTSAARGLMERIESRFGRMQIVSTCRAGATIAGSGRPSRHASGNAIDFDAGSKKSAVINWLTSNHHSGGTMTYSGMDHVHVDIGSHFVSLAGGRVASNNTRPSKKTRDWSNDSTRMSLGAKTARYKSKKVQDDSDD